MKLEEAIEVYNSLYKNENIELYHKAISVLLEETNKRKPEQEYFKSSNKYDYYIEKPYEEMYFGTTGIEFRQHSYNAIGKSKGYGTVNFCLSLCNYSLEKIMTIIENHIIEDNEWLNNLGVMLNEWTL